MAQICIVTMKVKTPKLRIWVSLSVIRVIAPFIRRQETADRIMEVLGKWVINGVKVSVA